MAKISMRHRFGENAESVMISKNKRMIFYFPQDDGSGFIRAKNGKDDLSMNVKRGDIYYADLSPVVGSEQGGVRPVLIVQNDVGNKFSPTVIAAAITSQTEKSHLPTHIYVQSMECGLHKDSVVLLEQIRTLDKRRLKECMGRLEDSTMDKVDHAISISFGLGADTAGIRKAN